MNVEGVAEITYRLDGVLKTWPVSCHVVNDNEQSMRRHLKRCIPRAKFVSVTITPVKKWRGRV
jgi:hypothetical protein